MTLHQVVKAHRVIIEVVGVEMDGRIQRVVRSLRWRRTGGDRAANHWIVDVVLVCEVDGVVAELVWMHVTLGVGRETRMLLWLHVGLHSFLVGRVRICSHERLHGWAEIVSGAPLGIVESLTIIHGPHRSRRLIYSSTLGKGHRRAA